MNSQQQVLAIFVEVSAYGSSAVEGDGSVLVSVGHLDRNGRGRVVDRAPADQTVQREGDARLNDRIYIIDYLS